MPGLHHLQGLPPGILSMLGGVVDLDYRGEGKMVLFNHSVEGLAV